MPEDPTLAPAASDRVRAAYDSVARDYDAALRDELATKPLDRALLRGFLELCGEGTVADVGCGPGHVTRFLAQHHPEVIGVDLSPEMVAVARGRAPELTFEEGSMLDLPFADDAWAGAVSLYAVIHLDADQRRHAMVEFARVIRPGGWLLVSFHVEDADHRRGDVQTLRSWWGHDVDVDFHYIDPQEVEEAMVGAGFAVQACVDREPFQGGEHASRRTYLLARNGGD